MIIIGHHNDITIINYLPWFIFWIKEGFNQSNCLISFNHISGYGEDIKMRNIISLRRLFEYPPSLQPFKARDMSFTSSVLYRVSSTQSVLSWSIWLNALTEKLTFKKTAIFCWNDFSFCSSYEYIEGNLMWCVKRWYKPFGFRMY